MTDWADPDYLDGLCDDDRQELLAEGRQRRLRGDGMIQRPPVSQTVQMVLEQAQLLANASGATVAIVNGTTLHTQPYRANMPDRQKVVETVRPESRKRRAMRGAA